MYSNCIAYVCFCKLQGKVFPYTLYSSRLLQISILTSFHPDKMFAPVNCDWPQVVTFPPLREHSARGGGGGL